MEYLALILILIGMIGALNKTKKLNYSQKKQKGDNYEKKVGLYYENKGYQVMYNGLEKGRKDEGIDLICTKEEEHLLIQCKNWDKFKIRHFHVKAFHSDCIKYIEEKNLDKSLISLKFAIPKNDILHNSAIKIFQDAYYNCRYEII